MKEALKVLLLMFIYPIGMFIYVIFNGYPSMIGGVAMILSVPAVFVMARCL